MEAIESLLPAETQALGAKVDQWPIEVRALIAYLSKSRGKARNMRKNPRKPLHIEATLRFRREDGSSTATPIYTRDTSGPVVGILTQTAVSVGQHVILEWEDVSRVARRLDCSVMRCRQCRDGWYEGALVLRSSRPAADPNESGGLWKQLCTLLGV